MRQFNRFSTLATLRGYEVIDKDGRAVAERPSRASAQGVAFRLNRAASAGSHELARTLSRLR